jgi:hypothetical protein
MGPEVLTGSGGDDDVGGEAEQSDEVDAAAVGRMEVAPAGGLSAGTNVANMAGLAVSGEEATGVDVGGCDVEW